LKTKIIFIYFEKTLYMAYYSAGAVVVNSEVVELAPGTYFVPKKSGNPGQLKLAKAQHYYR
jgi:hypothetical protein